MKITIYYDGSTAKCIIETLDDGIHKAANFNKAYIETQLRALDAFRVIKEAFERDKKLKRNEMS